ncbi:MAG: peroxide stress protein YaaA [Flavicella sp.]
MKIVISPAKSLDFESKLPTESNQDGIFLEDAALINTVLKEKSPADLSDLMSISSKLGDLNWQRNQEWQLPFTSQNARQAVFAFKGDVYVGLDAYSLSEDKLAVLASKLRILSGLYGMLRPLDLIQPYRLEMGTKISINTYKNLYQFWGSKITDKLNSEMQEGEFLVNLASTEYFKVIQPKALNAPVITPHFKDYKNGKLKIVSFYAKKARGMMVRYIVDHNIETIEGLKGFDTGGYVFDQQLSTETDLVFTR